MSATPSFFLTESKTAALTVFSHAWSTRSLLRAELCPPGPRLTCRSPNPQPLRMWLYLDKYPPHESQARSMTYRENYCEKGWKRKVLGDSYLEFIRWSFLLLVGTRFWWHMESAFNPRDICVLLPPHCQIWHLYLWPAIPMSSIYTSE